MQLPAVLQPRDMHEAWRMKRDLGEQSIYISGGTLLRTQWEAGTAAVPKYLIDTGSMTELKMIFAAADELEIGASAHLSQCLREPFIQQAAPAFYQALRSIAAPSIRNLATIGGNIASGIGDALPALLVHDTRLVWFDGRQEFELPLSDWLKADKSRFANDLLCKIRIPFPGQSGEEARGRINAYQKVGRREAFTPSLVTVAISGFIHRQGSFPLLRIAAGGGNAGAKRLSSVEAMLQAHSLQELSLASLYELAAAEYETYTDAFATAAYKKKMVGNLVAAEIWKIM